MNHGFFNTTQKVCANPCTGRAPVPQGKRKHGRAKPNLKQWWSVFSTSEGLFTWIGCLKVRPLTRSTKRTFWQTFMNGWEDEKDLKCGWMAHGFFTKTTRWETMPFVKTFLMKHKITMLEHPPYSPNLAPCDFLLISKDQVCVRNQVQVCRYSEGKSDRAHE